MSLAIFKAPGDHLLYGGGGFQHLTAGCDGGGVCALCVGPCLLIFFAEGRTACLQHSDTKWITTSRGAWGHDWEKKATTFFVGCHIPDFVYAWPVLSSL